MAYVLSIKDLLRYLGFNDILSQIGKYIM